MIKRFTVTIFGAESTGKTTLSRQLAQKLEATWLHEFARPYLEQTHADITNTSMIDIWRGQLKLQKQAQGDLVVQDTDLFSTVGYWQLPHVEPTLGPCPDELIADAHRLRSDLYIITKSNIPFEQDKIRYGGDRRESPDQYWIDLCENYALPYIVLDASSRATRVETAQTIIHERRILSCVAS
ncbi:MAG: ATP-binding protein [Candidatus Saccharimonas sp.]